jgi:hypothetical protein
MKREGDRRRKRGTGREAKVVKGTKRKRRLVDDSK